MKSLYTEWLKLKHTPIQFLILITPFIYAALLVLYARIRQASSISEQFTFQLFFEGAAVLVIPVAVAILAGLIIYQEELAGSFNGFLNSSKPRYQLFLRKISWMTLIIAYEIYMSTLLFGVGLSLFTTVALPWRILWVSATLIFVATLPLIELQTWLSFGWGVGASIGAGVVGVLFAGIVGGTGIGDAFWQFIPPAWPIRLVKTYELMYYLGDEAPLELLQNQFNLGLIAIMASLLILAIGASVWFTQWEGRQHYE